MNIDLTHPEILTVEQLQAQLRKFVGGELTDDKCELIQLFYKYITPLPQRKFRANRLGTLLTGSQKQFGGETRSLPADASLGEKHESDRGIYTVTMQKPAVRNTAPIKLKRPPPTTAPTDEDAASKRIKLDATTT